MLADDVDRFTRQMRESGMSDYAVHPQTDSREKYLIKHIAPLTANRQALGLDISFETGRRTAADRARETGLPQLTPRILLVQDDTQTPGFLLLRPAYERAAARQGDFLGWVYAPFIGRNLLQDLTPNQGRVYHFKVFDGPQADPEKLIFDSDTQGTAPGGYHATKTVEFFGRPWTIVYSSTPGFDKIFSDHVAFIILAAGILLSGMLAYVMRAMRLHGMSLAEVAELRGSQISAREEQNRSLVENAVVAVFILDHNHNILFANNAAVDCFGCHKDGMGGLPISDFITELEDVPADAGFNSKGVTATGDTLFLDVQRNSWVTLNGVGRVTTMVRNVTAEVEAVSELAATKQRYDRALEGSGIGVFELDLKSGTSIVSQTWLRIMDVGPEETDAQGAFLNRIHPGDLPRLLKEDRNCIAGETDRSMCEFRMNFNGTWRWMRSDAIVVGRAADGTALRLLGTQVDVTQLRHARNALEESETRFRTVLEAAPVGMAILDAEANFTSVNAAICDLTGYSSHEMLDQITLSKLMLTEDMKQMRDAVYASIRSGKQKVYSAEHRIMRKDGGACWGLFNITWTFDKNTGAHVFIAQVNDITDKKKIDEIKSEFVSTVSHELRTPLTSIKGALGLIGSSASDSLAPSVRRLIDIAQTNVTRLTEIVNDILDLEKISSGDIAFDLVPLDMGQMVRASVDQMLPFAVTHHNQLKVDLPETALTVTADRGRLMQVLANLISNACKYSTDNTEVKVIVEQLEDVAITYVQNIGPGVPESFRNRIFQAFSQADGSDTRAKGGTGLGLNITRQIVKRMGGDIGFESKPNGPTIFWFTCPIARSPRADIEKESVSPKSHTTGRLKVLHVEDDCDFAEVIRAGLSPFADVSSATHLHSARHALAAGPLDVVILDWKLPDGDAADLIEEIRAAHPSARIVGLSSVEKLTKEGSVSVNLLKSRTELSQIIDTVTKGAKQVS